MRAAREDILRTKPVQSRRTRLVVELMGVSCARRAGVIPTSCPTRYNSGLYRVPREGVAWRRSFWGIGLAGGC
jgi:hypothetical protein